MFLDLQPVLSYNALFNILIGERGVGKTYGCKKFCIKDFLKNGNKFVYLRRYESELKESCNGFFTKLIKNKEFEGHEMKVVYKKKSVTFTIDGEEMGYGLVLSTALQLKSREFPDVKNLIFDEFIITKGVYHYLQNEVHDFLDICETIFRLEDFRAFLLGNATNRANPYFEYFKLDLPYNTEIKTYEDGDILVCKIKNEAYREAKKKTRFGRLTSKTAYGRYAIDNEWLYENKTFIEKRPDKAKFYFTLKVKEIDYGIWCDYNSSKIYISSAYDPSCPIIFTLNPDDHNENTRLVSIRRSDFFKNIIEHYKMGLLCFESQKIKTVILPIINHYAI